MLDGLNVRGDSIHIPGQRPVGVTFDKAGFFLR
jgi:hypothetical protein